MISQVNLSVNNHCLSANFCNLSINASFLLKAPSLKAITSDTLSLFVVLARFFTNSKLSSFKYSTIVTRVNLSQAFNLVSISFKGFGISRELYLSCLFVSKASFSSLSIS